MMTDSGYGSWAQYRQRLSEVRRPLFKAHVETHPYSLEVCRRSECGQAWREWWVRHDSPSAGEPAWTPDEGAAVILGVVSTEELCDEKPNMG